MYGTPHQQQQQSQPPFSNGNGGGNNPNPYHANGSSNANHPSTFVGGGTPGGYATPQKQPQQQPPMMMTGGTMTTPVPVTPQQQQQQPMIGAMSYTPQQQPGTVGGGGYYPGTPATPQQPQQQQAMVPSVQHQAVNQWGLSSPAPTTTATPQQQHLQPNPFEPSSTTPVQQQQPRPAAASPYGTPQPQQQQAAAAVVATIPIQPSPQQQQQQQGTTTTRSTTPMYRRATSDVNMPTTTTAAATTTPGGGGGYQQQAASIVQSNSSSGEQQQQQHNNATNMTSGYAASAAPSTTRPGLNNQRAASEAPIRPSPSGETGIIPTGGGAMMVVSGNQTNQYSIERRHSSPYAGANDLALVEYNPNQEPIGPSITPSELEIQRQTQQYGQILATRDATLHPQSSPLPNPNAVLAQGYVLSRISFRTILMKKWKQTYWIQYGPSQLLLFRTQGDYMDWLSNPYHTQKMRDFLVKLTIDFVGDLEKPNVVAYQCTRPTMKCYKRGGPVMRQFKLERWMDYGASIAAAFASPNAKELDELRNTITKCLHNAEQSAGMNGQYASTGVAPVAPQGRGYGDNDQDEGMRGGVRIGRTRRSLSGTTTTDQINSSSTSLGGGGGGQQ